MTALTDAQMAVVREIAREHWLRRPNVDVDDITDAILAALSDPRLSRRDEWISVDERLPELPKGCASQSFLVWIDGYQFNPKKCTYCPEWDGNKWAETIGKKVTHWQPLPEPPKE